jgi:hypothetical protein
VADYRSSAEAHALTASTLFQAGSIVGPLDNGSSAAMPATLPQVTEVFSLTLTAGLSHRMSALLWLVRPTRFK